MTLPQQERNPARSINFKTRLNSIESKYIYDRLTGELSRTRNGETANLHKSVVVFLDINKNSAFDKFIGDQENALTSIADGRLNPKGIELRVVERQVDGKPKQINQPQEICNSGELFLAIINRDRTINGIGVNGVKTPPVKVTTEPTVGCRVINMEIPNDGSLPMVHIGGIVTN